MAKLTQLYLAVLFIWSLPAAGQELSSYRSKAVPLTIGSIRLDSLTIDPGSLVVIRQNGDTLPGQFYELDVNNSVLYLKEAYPEDTLLFARYRVFPVNLAREYSNKKIENVVFDQGRIPEPYVYRYQPSGGIDEVFRMDGLSKSGSISRGISFGNSQDVVVNSNFDLQLSGKLGPEVEVLAAITDNNIPIQPYGNTQVIQEFDKVFIQLSMRRTSLIAGDFNLTRPPGYFMNFFKKLQGGMVDAEVSLKKGAPADKPYIYKIKAAAALSKGKFARNRLQGIEGNQGPYRLSGAEGENFIIVLAGTEKVYVDGRLLTRGESFDYVIDYNTAEITFTPNVLITKDKRIVVEFEYSDRRYARSLFFAGNEFVLNRSRISLNVYSEQDLKNQSLEQDLSDVDKQYLSTIGDDLEKAFRPGYDSLGYSQDDLRYALTDTLVNGIYYDTVFFYSTNPDSAVYSVRFSRVGPNRGDYVRKSSTVNGRIYEWVAPVEGVPQGDHEAVRFLVTPKKTQMFVLSGDHRFSENSGIHAEVALSGRDLNTFSSGGNSDDVGLGIKMGAKHTGSLGKNESNPWQLAGRVDYEFVNRDFRPIERYRSVEFERDWNLEEQYLDASQHYSSLIVELSKGSLTSIDYELSAFLSGDLYRGFRNRAGFDLDYRDFRVEFNGSIMNSRQEGLNTRFIRQIGSVSKNFRKIIVGINEESENNSLREIPSDSLTPASFSYFQWEAYVKSPDTAKMPFKVFYRSRIDNLPGENDLDRATVGRDVGFSWGLAKSSGHRFTLSATYRLLENVDTALALQPPENNLLGRIEHYLRVLKGAITFNTFYEVGSGLDRKQEFYYLKVAAGEGLYAWIDYNGDGIEQINEFEIASFKDQANYIRVYVQSDQYVRGYYNKFTESINLQPAAVWKDQKGFLGFLARLSNQLTYRTESKSNADDPELAYNPFTGPALLNDTSLVSKNSSFRNTLYFDRMNPRITIDLNLTRNNAKTLLVNGFEFRRIVDNALNLRWNFYGDLTLKSTVSQGTSERTSEFFPGNNYSLEIYNAIPSLIWQAGTNLRFEARYRYSRKKNETGDPGELAVINDAGVEANYRIANKGNLLARANYIKITYSGAENSSLAYEMLEGLQPGNNATWNISYQQNLSRFLQLNLVYDGRKSGDAAIVHVGSLQVRAHF